MNNILIALTARKYGFNPAFYLVGDDVVTKALAVSGARDFGLGTELDYIDDVIRLFAFLIMPDIIERWTHIDKERGGKVFRSLVEQLKNEVEIPQEFKK